VAPAGAAGLPTMIFSGGTPDAMISETAVPAQDPVA